MVEPARVRGRGAGDFASLYRTRREPAEDKLFLPGLQASNVWYGHQLSVCWMQTELPEGFAERMLAMCLAVSYIGSGWVRACAPPLERWACVLCSNAGAAAGPARGAAALPARHEALPES